MKNASQAPGHLRFCCDMYAAARAIMLTRYYDIRLQCWLSLIGTLYPCCTRCSVVRERPKTVRHDDLEAKSSDIKYLVYLRDNGSVSSRTANTLRKRYIYFEDDMNFELAALHLISDLKPLFNATLQLNSFLSCSVNSFYLHSQFAYVVYPVFVPRGLPNAFK